MCLLTIISYALLTNNLKIIFQTPVDILLSFRISFKIHPYINKGHVCKQKQVQYKTIKSSHAHDESKKMLY